MIYYGLNVCDLPKFLCWNPNSSVMVFRGGACQKSLGREGGALTNGISALGGDDLSPPMRLSKKAALRWVSSLVPSHADTLISDFQTPELKERNFCVLNYPVSVPLF